MNMQVMYFLTTFCTGICNDAKAAFWVRLAPLLNGKSGCQHHHSAKQGSMLRLDLRHRQDMRFRNDQEMNRCPGIDVMKGENFIVFINLAAWNGARSYFAKNAIAFNHDQAALTRIHRATGVHTHHALDDAVQKPNRDHAPGYPAGNKKKQPEP